MMTLMPPLTAEALLDDIPQIVWVTGTDGAVAQVNDRWRAFTGMAADEALGSGWLRAVHPDDAARLVSLMERGPSERETINLEYRMRRSDGEYRWMMTQAVRTRHGDAAGSSWVGTTTDIHEMHLLIEDLRKAKDQASEANAAKSQFLANMSHEIRTPLGAIMGFADLLREDGLSPKDRSQFLEAIVRNGRNVVTLIADILDLSKVESGRLDIEHVRVRLEDLLTDVSAELNRQASAKNICLIIERVPGLPDSVVTDPLRLRQILLNIVGNAVKFTEHGAVTVRIDYQRHEIGSRLTIAVTDTGPGMNAKQQRRLFQAFSQGDAGTTRRYGGTGLGLLLSRNLARLLGGDVVLARSAPGEGSTFVVTVAAEAAVFPEGYAPQPAPEIPAFAPPAAPALLAELGDGVRRALQGGRGALHEVLVDRIGEP